MSRTSRIQSDEVARLEGVLERRRRGVAEAEARLAAAKERLVPKEPIKLGSKRARRRKAAA